MELEPPYDTLDPGIRDAVKLLYEGGVETFESCQGGEGHSYPEPTIRFAGERQDGFRALALALGARLKVSCLRRIWTVLDDEPTGPYWEIVFVPDSDAGVYQKCGIHPHPQEIAGGKKANMMQPIKLIPRL